MVAQLTARALRAAHGTRVLFDGLDLTVAPGAVIGLVGPNGAGKSTLLRLLAGIDAPEDGTVALSPRDATVGLLPQETQRVQGETLIGFVLRRTGVADAQAELDAATLALADPGAEAVADRYDTALHRWLTLGGADVEHRLGEAMADVGLDLAPEHLMTALSGGQAARASLASLLLSRFDVLLLDEPTNDLDLAGLERLERFVTDTAAGMVIVSHDREFLSRTVNAVVEIDMHQGTVNRFGGGYDSYLTERERARTQARERYDEYTDKVGTLKERARTQRSWADKGVKGQKANPPDGDKTLRNRRIETTEKLAGKARRTERQLERLDEVDEPRKEWDLQFSIASAPPSGTVVASLGGAVVDRGAFRLGPVTLQVDRGDRMAITGPNGAGKTTLLGLLTGELAPDSGTATLGASVQVGSVDQARAAFGGDVELLDAFCAEMPDWPMNEVRTLLAKFGLRADHVEREVDELSPGERTRAGLALLQARGTNVLVLDEPTNHLDLPAIEQLEEALDAYDGTLLLVSHDRRLLDAVHVTRRVALDAGRVTESG